MEIRIVEENKKEYLPLLLLADESEKMIDKYLGRGNLFALFDGDLRGICVVSPEGGDYEIKNLATYPQYQNQGCASRLIDYVCEHYKNAGRSMFVGTGESLVGFYERRGFSYSHTVKNFFIDNYEIPMFDNGQQLTDMIYLKKDL